MKSDAYKVRHPVFFVHNFRFFVSIILTLVCSQTYASDRFEKTKNTSELVKKRAAVVYQEILSREKVRKLDLSVERINSRHETMGHPADLEKSGMRESNALVVRRGDGEVIAYLPNYRISDLSAYETNGNPVLERLTKEPWKIMHHSEGSDMWVHSSYQQHGLMKLLLARVLFDEPNIRFFRAGLWRSNSGPYETTPYVKILEAFGFTKPYFLGVSSASNQSSVQNYITRLSLQD